MNWQKAIQHYARLLAVGLLGFVALQMIRVTIFGPLIINDVPISSLWMLPFAITQIWASTVLWERLP